MKHKTCKQCGQIKVETEFRLYYHKTKSDTQTRYRICKSCESINTRYKYLQSKQVKETASDQELQELTKIEELYDLLESRGLTPPKRNNAGKNVMEAVDELLQIHQAAAEQSLSATGATNTPAELTEWLTKELSGDPAELREQFETLEEKYRPQTGVDNKTFKPVFDDTYKDILIKIEDNIDMYEDNYYADLE